MQQFTPMSRRQVLAAAGMAGVVGTVSVLTARGSDDKEKKPWEGHKTADPKEVEEAYNAGKTGYAERIQSLEKNFAPRSGIAPSSCVLRPDLNGLRVKLPNQPAIYLIDQGYRRWIPDPPTYNNLFRDWSGIVVDIDTTSICESTPITSGAVLALGLGTAPVYLVDNGHKRWVTSPATMDKYWFAWNKVVQVPPVLLMWIPDSSPIS